MKYLVLFLIVVSLIGTIDVVMSKWLGKALVNDTDKVTRFVMFGVICIAFGDLIEAVSR